MLNLEDILDKIQELIGAPQGAFYNIQSRIRAVDALHSNLVRETLAITRTGQAVVREGKTLVEDVPSDFLSFLGSPIVYADGVAGSGSYGGYLVWDSWDIDYEVLPVVYGDPEGIIERVGDWQQLSVVSSRDLDTMYRAWDSDPRVDTPHSLVVRSPGVFELYPRPRTDGLLSFAYVSDGGGIRDADPTKVLEWVPFGGDAMLNKYAMMLAYGVAADLMVARNPEVSAYLRQTFDQELRKMRNIIRYDPAKNIHVAPGGLGRYAYASRN